MSCLLDTCTKASISVYTPLIKISPSVVPKSFGTYCSIKGSSFSTNVKLLSFISFLSLLDVKLGFISLIRDFAVRPTNQHKFSLPGFSFSLSLAFLLYSRYSTLLCLLPCCLLHLPHRVKHHCKSVQSSSG